MGLGITGRFWSSICATGFLAGSILAGAAYGQEVASQSVVSPDLTPSSTTTTTTTTNNAAIEVDPASLLPDLPALPPTKASLIGGSIQKVDRVRDQLTLEIFGGGKMKVLFDPRTHIYEGKAQGSALDLRPGDRVYVDTILDGSMIFARDIRIADAASGRSQGVVISYRADKDELVLRDLLSPEPIKLRLTPSTKFLQNGHSAFASQLVPGTLIEVNFAVQKAAQKNDREAQQVSILAVPGTDFTFAGRVISLDLHIGLLVLQSATDHKTYEIYLDPSAIAIDDRLRAGADVSTVANFDGSRYVARSLTVNSR
ncbi:MAG: hypothetical protein WB523_16185 [Candidatus Sulfotelmatobacter sp.]